MILPFILLFIALLMALGFEFINGFHDTANAVATVIYTDDEGHAGRRLLRGDELPRRLLGRARSRRIVNLLPVDCSEAARTPASSWSSRC